MPSGAKIDHTYSYELCIIFFMLQTANSVKLWYHVQQISGDCITSVGLFYVPFETLYWFICARDTYCHCNKGTDYCEQCSAKWNCRDWPRFKLETSLSTKGSGLCTFTRRLDTRWGPSTRQLITLIVHTPTLLVNWVALDGLKAPIFIPALW